VIYLAPTIPSSRSLIEEWVLSQKSAKMAAVWLGLEPTQTALRDLIANRPYPRLIVVLVGGTKKSDYLSENAYVCFLPHSDDFLPGYSGYRNAGQCCET